jgi:hypothetical protein
MFYDIFTLFLYLRLLAFLLFIHVWPRLPSLIDGDTFFRQKLSHQRLMANTLPLFPHFSFILINLFNQTDRGPIRSGRGYFRSTIKKPLF